MSRFAFIKSRSEYLIKQGVCTEDANDRANNDYRLVAKLSRYNTPNLDDVIREGKGSTLCNRTACQSDKHVMFHNFVMQKNYCLSCATDIRFCNNLDELDLYPEYNETLDKLFGELNHD